MMGTEAPPAGGVPGSPVFLFVYVEDVDAVVARAVELGATLKRTPEDQFYGDRDGSVVDPYGHWWTVATHVEDVAPEEMERRMAAMLEQGVVPGWSVKDLLAHVATWEEEAVQALQLIVQGKRPPRYGGVDGFNARRHELHASLSLPEARDRLRESHRAAFGYDDAVVASDDMARDIGEVDEDTFYRTRESGGTRISSAYKVCVELIGKQLPPSEWNIYCFQFSDGDNWGEDNEQSVRLLTDNIVPHVNLFCYGQVESPYGSGEFIRALRGGLEDTEDKVVLSEIADKEAIFESIKAFLGKGK